jgi:hypothetical protein
MTKEERDEVRAIVREELIGIIEDAQAKLGTTKDPTGIGRKVLGGLASLIRTREAGLKGDGEN